MGVFLTLPLYPSDDRVPRITYSDAKIYAVASLLLAPIDGTSLRCQNLLLRHVLFMDRDNK
jgi:hypothetical protein